MTKRLPPSQIGKYSQLLEWQSDWSMDVPNPKHRHISQLYALRPSNQISPIATPEPAAAARKTLELRGDAGTGWSLGFCYTNLFDAHPPFQIDGSFLLPALATRVVKRIYHRPPSQGSL